MDNIINALREFVESHLNDEGKDDLRFDWFGSIIRYYDAEYIINTIEGNTVNEQYLNERVDELEDYNRLLREENRRLKEANNDMP